MHHFVEVECCRLSFFLFTLNFVRFTECICFIYQRTSLLLKLIIHTQLKCSVRIKLQLKNYKLITFFTFSFTPKMAKNSQFTQFLLYFPDLLEQEEKKNIIIIVRREMPTLELKIQTKMGSKEWHHDFDSKYNEQYEWVTKCHILYKLFCSLCLLFCQYKNTWTTTATEQFDYGFVKTQKSQNPLNSIIALKIFGWQQAASIWLHNRSAEKNHDILKRVIHCIEIWAW